MENKKINKNIFFDFFYKEFNKYSEKNNISKSPQNYKKFISEFMGDLEKEINILSEVYDKNE